MISEYPDGSSDLAITCEVDSQVLDYMSEAWNKALLRIRKLAEELVVS